MLEWDERMRPRKTGEPSVWTPPGGLGCLLRLDSAPPRTNAVLDARLAVRLDLERRREGPRDGTVLRFEQKTVRHHPELQLEPCR